MKIITIMSMTGSIMIIAILLLKLLIRHSFSSQWQSFLLRLAMIYYLVPMPFIRSAYQWIEQRLFISEFYPSMPKAITITRQSAALLLTGTQGAINRSGWLYWLVTSVWLAVTLFLFIKHTRRYRKYTGLIACTLPLAADSELFVLLNSLKKELGLTANIKTYLEPSRKEAFSMGILNPIIVLPANMDKTKMKLILRHELMHIKNKDFLIKGTALLVLCLHWFNPFAYLLMKLLNLSSELTCDEKVVASLTAKERLAYGELIIEMAVTAQKKFLLVSPIKSNYKEMKRRLTYIMNKKMMSGKMKVVMVFTSIFLIFGCSLTSFAYDKTADVMSIRGEAESINQQMEGFSTADISFTEDYFILPIEQNSHILFEHQFVDENNNVYNADNIIRKACAHKNQVSGTFQQHYVPGDGSCIVRNYPATRCTDCGIITLGKLLSENRFPVCVHD